MRDDCANKEYIILLRGINVSGNTMIKMEELRAMFEALGFLNVTTYINSGNIAFDRSSRRSTRSKATSSLAAEQQITAKIESAIEKHFGKQIPVMVRTNNIARIIANNPFDVEFESHKEMHVLFLKEEMPPDKQEQLLAAAPEGERFAVRTREIYCHLKLGVADSLRKKLHRQNSKCPSPPETGERSRNCIRAVSYASHSK